MSRRLLLVCTFVVLVTLVLPTSGLGSAWAIPTALAKGPKPNQPNHSPTSAAAFAKAATAAKQQQRLKTPTWVPVQIPGPSVYSGKKPGDAAPAAGKVRTHPASVQLDARFLKGQGDTAAPIHWYPSSEGVLEIGVPEGAIDLSAVTATATTTTPTAPTPTAPTPATTTTPPSVSTSSPTPGTPGATPPADPPSSPTGTDNTTPPAVTGAPHGYTLALTQTGGTVFGETAVLGTYSLQVVDARGKAVPQARLVAPIRLRLHYAAGELDSLNPMSFLLSWPQTGDQQANVTAAAVPVTLDPTAKTLTATVPALRPGPMVLSAGIADANQASSEHLTDDANLGDVGFSLPLDLPPAAGGLVPPLQLVYNSGGPNGRHSRQAPAGALGDGWDLSLGSITYDASNDMYYLNGVGGVSEPLLCCMSDTAGVKYFVPHHHPEVHVYTLNNQIDPKNDAHATGFTVLTPDGLEYRLGWKGGANNAFTVVNASRRATVSGGVKQWYEWDVNEVVRRDAPNLTDSYLQKYTLDFWHDDTTFSSITFTRDAYIKDVYYNYDTGGTAHARVYFNIHWPESTTTDAGTGAIATTYGNNYNCASAPPSTTAQRCDDPITPNGWIQAPLTKSTITVDQMVVQVTDSTGAWKTVRTYDFGYNLDDPWTQCSDQFTGQNIACAGEHTLKSVQETPYQNGVAQPSRQPTVFAYTAKELNEYHDLTVLDGSGHPLDGQNWWRYLVQMTDQQTGADARITWQEAYGNTHGVPSGQQVLDPLTCSQSGVTCTNPDDRQWPRHVVTQVWDKGNNTTTTYRYQLNNPCGSSCTQDTWIPPNAWAACGDSGLPPTNPNQSCLTTDSTNYYDEEYTGFAAVTTTHPDGATTVDQYYAGNGWGTNDWDDGNRLRARLQDTKEYAGAAMGNNPLREVAYGYSDSTKPTCPEVDSGTHTQLYKNPYLMCQVFMTQRVTSFWEGSDANTLVPTKTETWTYDPTSTTTNHYFTALTSSAVTGNDLTADSYGTTSSQPTFTTAHTYVWDDQVTRTTGGPITYLYHINLPAQTTLGDDPGTHWTCTQTRYDGLGYLTGQQSTLLYGLATQADAYADCGTSPNYTLAGGVSTGTGYDSYGQTLVATDADAFAGIAGHVGCSSSGTLLVVGKPVGATTYTSCTTYDSVQHAYTTATANALNQQSTATYDVVQGVQLTATDANGQVTATPAPTYEYSGTPHDLAHYQDAFADTKLPGEAANWTTRTFAFSFCTNSAGTFLSGTTPCLEVDTVQQLDGTNLTVKRAFYDREGRLVETRSSGPDSSHDVVTFTSYNEASDTVFSSLPCTVAALSTSNGGRSVTSTPGYIAPAAVTAGSGAYIDPMVSGTNCYNIAGSVTYQDALGRTIATDDALGTGAGASGTGCLVGSLHHTTCTVYQIGTPTPPPEVNCGQFCPVRIYYVRATTIDANLHQNASYTDALGRTATTLHFNGSGQTPLPLVFASQAYATSTAQYDPAGNLRVLTQPNGGQSTATYDALKRKTATTDPDLGAWSYTYDANGNLRSSTDPRGAGGGGVVYANYDGLNRQLWRNTSDSSSGAYVTYTYDSTASGNKGVGRLTGESFTGGAGSHTLSGSYSYIYDDRGQTTQVTTTIGGTGYSLGYLYNDAGLPTRLTYSDGEALTTGYGATGWLNAVSTTPAGGSQVNMLTGLTFGGPALQLTSATEGGGVYAYAASYDNDGRQMNAQLTRTSDSAIVFSTARTYDAVGNVTGVATRLPSGTDNQAFCYDELNRLVWAGSMGTPSCGGTLTAGTLTSAQYTQSFTYDTRNRLTAVTSSGATGSSPGSYTYGDAAHLDAATATAGGYSTAYDAVGDMVCRAPTSTTTCAGGSPTGATLAYDAERQLTHSVSDTSTPPTAEAWYLYDGSGHRVEQAVSLSGGTVATTTYLPGGAEELRSDGSLVKYYSAAGMGLGLNTAHDASGISFLGDDGLGSLQVALNSSGVAVASQLFAPYGAMRYANGTMPTAKGFTGQYSDAAVSGLDYYNARYYDPILGQFSSADSAIDGPNRYAYVSGNPETVTDPSGHSQYCPHGCGHKDDKQGSGDDDDDDTDGKATGCDRTCQDNHDKGMLHVITGIAGLTVLVGGALAACFGPIPVACGVAWKALGPLMAQALHSILDGIGLLHQSAGGKVGDTVSLIVATAKLVVDAVQAILSIVDIVEAAKAFAKVVPAVTGIGDAIRAAGEADSYATRIANATDPLQKRALKAAQTRAENRAAGEFAQGIGGIAGIILGTDNVGDDIIDFRANLDAWQSASAA